MSFRHSWCQPAFKKISIRTFAIAFSLSATSPHRFCGGRPEQEASQSWWFPTREPGASGRHGDGSQRTRRVIRWRAAPRVSAKSFLLVPHLWMSVHWYSHHQTLSLGCVVSVVVGGGVGSRWQPSPDNRDDPTQGPSGPIHGRSVAVNFLLSSPVCFSTSSIFLEPRAGGPHSNCRVGGGAI